MQGGVRAENTDPLAQWPGHSEDKHAESSFTKNTGAHVVWILQSGEAGCSMARPSSWGLLLAFSGNAFKSANALDMERSFAPL